MAYARYPQSFKLKIVKEVIQNKRMKGIKSRIADKYGISIISVSNWVKEFKDKIDFPDNGSENESKSTETLINKVLEENEVLKSVIIQKELEIKQIKNQYNRNQQTLFNG